MAHSTDKIVRWLTKVLTVIFVWEKYLYIFHCVKFVIYCIGLIVFPSVFLFQSKEIAFQLQEDLMKVLNELYTVSSNGTFLFLLLTHLHTVVFAVVEMAL